VLHSDAAAQTEIYRRFQDEARIISALRHPHIVQVTDFDCDKDGTPFIVMELLEGEDLHHRLATLGRMPLNQVLTLALQVSSALQAAHDKGIVHRDIKPQNIFLVRHVLASGVSDSAKVVDFGISKIRRSASQATQSHMLLGTPQYMSPEAARGENVEIDGRADQFSLAVILYRALSGQLPFDGPDLMGILYKVVHEPHVPLAQWVPLDRALAKRREDRFETIGDFARALTCRAPEVGITAGDPAPPSALPVAGMPIVGPASTLSGSSGQTMASVRLPRRRVVAGGAALAVLLGLGIVAVATKVGKKRVTMDAGTGSALSSAAAPLVPAPAPSPARSASPVPSPTPAPAGPDRKAAAPASVRWQITSRPPGALVIADEKVLGRTPLLQEQERGTGKKMLTLRLRGFRDRTLLVDTGHDVTRDAVLRPIEKEPKGTTSDDPPVLSIPR
jgi:serine/threonine-protein kinase